MVMTVSLSKYILIFVVLFLIFTQKSLAVNVISGDSVTVDRNLSDSMITGGEITVTGNVNGDLIAAAGEIRIKGNVYGDVIMTGGNIEIDGDVSGKVMLAGGKITIDGNVGKFVVMAGGDLNIGRNAIIGDDVFAAGGSIRNDGTVKGNLSAAGGRYVNSGIVEGYENFKKVEGIPWYFSEIFKAGLLVLGLLLVYMIPSLFEKSHTLISAGLIENVKMGAFGFAFILLSAIIGFALIFSIIGAITGIFLLTAAAIAIMMSNLVVSYSVGRYALSGKTRNKYIYLTLGFAVIFLLTKLPYVGGLIIVITTFLGTGTLVHVIWNIKSGSVQFRE